MHIRMITAYVVIMASMLCFGCAQMTPRQQVMMTADRIPAELQDKLRSLEAEATDAAAETEAATEETEAISEEIIEVFASGSLVEPMSAQHLDPQPLKMETPDADVPAADVPYTVPSPADDILLTADDKDASLHDAYLLQQEIEKREEANRQKELDAERRRQARKQEFLSKQEAAKRRAEEIAAKQEACPGYNAEFIATLTEEEQEEAEYFYEQGYVFYRQNWSVLNDKPYGDDGFGLCGCGPTCAAAIIANLAGVPVTPEDMRQYAIEHHNYLPNIGTTYDFMISVPAQYGIKATQIYATDKEALYEALADENKLVLATMGPGDFTLGAHFMLYRGVTEDGKILIADSYSYEFSVIAWDYDELYSQLKTGYWIYELDT